MKRSDALVNNKRDVLPAEAMSVPYLGDRHILSVKNVPYLI